MFALVTGVQPCALPISVPAKAIDGFMDALTLKAIPVTQATRYGLVVHRADLRTFPATTRVFSSDGHTDIDRFQESALFPGTPVAIVHESADKDRKSTRLNSSH